jgi:large subunit ribosomal protein L18
MSVKTREQLRQGRHSRIRKKIDGTSARPRLAVYRSLKHIYAQIIDDESGRTIAAASSQDKGVDSTGNREGAKAVGLRLAERAKEHGITQVVFDRGGFRYHGRLASLADGAREGGLEF